MHARVLSKSLNTRDKNYVRGTSEEKKTKNYFCSELDVSNNQRSEYSS